jgi:HEAT repeat protein
VPALLLHHPSEPVVLRVLGILAHSNRKTAVPIINRIVEHPSSSVRAAAVAARSVLDSDPEKLRALLTTEQSEEIRATIAVNLIVSGALSRSEREEQTETLLRDGSAKTKVAFAEAIQRRSAPGFDGVLTALAAFPELEVRCAAVTAMGRVPSPALLPELVRALADEGTRAAAEQALAAHGDAAFEVLRKCFEDPSTAAGVRRRIPPAMALCSAEQAMPGLLGWLPMEPDGSVRFGMILVLERLVRQHPTLAVDKVLLGRSVSATIARAYWCLEMRMQLARGASQESARRTPGHELLHDLLRDKEANARARLFRLLGLLHPSEDLVHIYRSLVVSKELRASSVELIENILREPVRSAVLGLIDDCADSLRLARAGGYHRPHRFEYGALLAHLAGSDSETVREVTQYHVAELALASSSSQTAEVA